MRAKLHKFSIEISPTNDVSCIPKALRVFIRCLPSKHDLYQLVAQANRCVQQGIRPTAHITACHFNCKQDLIATLDSLYRVGCRSVLIMRGDQEPIGPFKNSIELLETGLFDAFEVGIVADPEQTNDKNLAYKLARNSNIAFVVTQWCENKNKIQKLINWLQKPVYLGVPGLSSMRTMLSMASRLNLQKVHTQLLSWHLSGDKIMESPKRFYDFLNQIDCLHIFSFNSLKQDIYWIRNQVQDVRFYD